MGLPQMKIQIHQKVLHRKNLSQELNWLATTAPAAVGGLAALQEHLAGSKFSNISQNVSLWWFISCTLTNWQRALAEPEDCLCIIQKAIIHHAKSWGFSPQVATYLLNWGLKLLCNSQNQTGEWIVGNKPFSRFFFSSEHHSLSALPPLGPVFFQHWPGGDRSQAHTGTHRALFPALHFTTSTACKVPLGNKIVANSIFNLKLNLSSTE